MITLFLFLSSLKGYTPSEAHSVRQTEWDDAWRCQRWRRVKAERGCELEQIKISGWAGQSAEWLGYYLVIKWLAEHLNKHMLSASCIGNVQMVMSHSPYFRFYIAAGIFHLNWGKHSFIHLASIFYMKRILKSLSNKISIKNKKKKWKVDFQRVGWLLKCTLLTLDLLVCHDMKLCTLFKLFQTF